MHAQTCLDEEVNTEGACVIFHIAGACHLHQHDLVRALPLFEKALQMLTNMYDISMLTTVRVYEDLGWLYIMLGRASEALGLYRKVFLLSDDKQCIATCNALHRMAMCYTLMGRYRKALTTLSKAFGIAQELGKNERMWKCTLGMAKAHTSLKEFTLAEDYYANALEQVEHMHDLPPLQSHHYIIQLCLAFGTSEWCQSRLVEKDMMGPQVLPDSPKHAEMLSECMHYINGIRDADVGCAAM